MKNLLILITLITIGSEVFASDTYVVPTEITKMVNELCND